MSDPAVRPLVVGTRGSRLALWQAEHIVARLRDRHPDRRFVLQSIRTHGDVDRSSALAEIGTRGIFVKEIENALLSGEIDMGVHSLKDLPSELHPGLELAAVSPREDPRDALVSHEGYTLAELPGQARLGTSSPRRSAQVLAIRPDLTVDSIRGNVDTRVHKALVGDFDGVVLAVAGLRRLGLDGHISEYIPLSVMLPAPGQGIIGVETRMGDEETLALVSAIDDVATHLAARAERAFVHALGGGCTSPLGAYATLEGGNVRLEVMLASPDGVVLLRQEALASARSPEEAGVEAARRILVAGGHAILAEIERKRGMIAGE